MIYCRFRLTFHWTVHEERIWLTCWRRGKWQGWGRVGAQRLCWGKHSSAGNSKEAAHLAGVEVVGAPPDPSSTQLWKGLTPLKRGVTLTPLPVRLLTTPLSPVSHQDDFLEHRKLQLNQGILLGSIPLFYSWRAQDRGREKDLPEVWQIKTPGLLSSLHLPAQTRGREVCLEPQLSLPPIRAADMVFCKNSQAQTPLSYEMTHPKGIGHS